LPYADVQEKQNPSTHPSLLPIRGNLLQNYTQLSHHTRKSRKVFDKMIESNTEVELVEISDESQFEVAIIGGGITGLALAIGLLQRNIKFMIYERARTFREIGAGIGFNPNAERAMMALNPALHTAFRKVAAQNDEDYFYYVDGYNV